MSCIRCLARPLRLRSLASASVLPNATTITVSSSSSSSSSSACRAGISNSVRLGPDMMYTRCFSSVRGMWRQGSTARGTIGAGSVAADVSGEARRLQGAIEIEAPDHLNEKEREIWELLKERLRPDLLEVQDISGGCGSMYGIEIVSEAFRGLNMLKQQRLVNEILGDEIKKWHGVQLKTRTP